MSKYNNKKVVFNNIKFDSKLEAKRYGELLLLEKAGAITNLELQKSFELIPTQYETLENGKKGKCLEMAVTYRADFVYTENGKQVVEDVKGMTTRDYIIKRKLMLYKYGIKIKEVRK